MQDPSPVQGRGGQEVEQAQEQVDRPQPAKGAGSQRPAGVLGQHRQPYRGTADHTAGERADQGDDQLGGRLVTVALDPGQAAHEPQRDAVDLQFRPARRYGMCDLVHQDADQQGGSSQASRQPVGVLRVTRDIGGQARRGQEVGDQAGQSEQAPVDAHFDAPQVAQFEAVLQSRPPSRLPLGQCSPS